MEINHLNTNYSHDLSEKDQAVILGFVKKIKLKHQIDLIKSQNLEVQNISLNVLDYQAIFDWVKIDYSFITWMGIEVSYDSKIIEGVAQIHLNNEEERMVKFY